MAGVNLVLDRVFVEVRFPRRLAFIDQIGRIADIFYDSFDEAAVTEAELRLSTHEGDELILEPARIVAHHHRGDSDWALFQVTEALSVLAKVVGVEEVDYVGARQVFLQEVGGVAEATALFRATFFNYKEGALRAFGDEPTEAQARVAFRVPEGTCKVTATAITQRRPAEEGAGSEEPPGALLIDVDRANDLGTYVLTARDVAEGLLTDGRARAVDFVSGLKGFGPGDR